jgi:hypothetical protein
LYATHILVDNFFNFISTPSRKFAYPCGHAHLRAAQGTIAFKDTTKGNGASDGLGERVIGSCRTSRVIKGLKLDKSDVAALWLALSIHEETMIKIVFA